MKKNLFLFLCFGFLKLNAQCPTQPTISANNTTIICGSSVILTASGCAGTILWDTGETTLQITKNPNITKSYKVTCTSNNCAVSAEKEIVVKPNQNIAKIWDKRYGGSSSNDPKQLLKTADGGMLMAGNTIGATGGDVSSTIPKAGYWIIKTDVDGNKIFDKMYQAGPAGSSCSVVIQRVLEDSDGTFLLIGSSNCTIGYDKSQNPLTYSGGFPNPDVWIIKIDKIGTKLWDKVLNTRYITDAKMLSDGSFIICQTLGVDGVYTTPSFGSNDYAIAKFDRNGDKLWDKKFGGTASDQIESIIKTSDGGMVLIGHSQSQANGNKTAASIFSDYWIVKINDKGIKEWDRTITGNRYDSGYTGIEAKDGSLIISGVSGSGLGYDKSENGVLIQGFPAGGIWTIKLDRFGNKIWDKTYSGITQTNVIEFISQIIEDKNGNFTFIAQSASDAGFKKSENTIGNASGLNLWLVNVDKSNGNVLWDKTIGSTGNQDFFANQAHTISNYDSKNNLLYALGIANGTNDYDFSSTPKGAQDFLLLKLWLPTPPEIQTSKTTVCNGENTTIYASGCPGTITWSTGAIANSITVSPGINTTYIAKCTAGGAESCNSDPITIQVCNTGTQTTFGYTAGNFGASDNGGANYSIPIQIPAGTAGVKPSISINYNNNGGNGLLGVGWSLGGLQAIDRTAKSRAQDEAFKETHNIDNGISLSKADRFSLNGARLVLKPDFIQNSQVLNANYGEKGTEYILENNNFTKIGIPDTLSNGAPKYFLAYSKDGLIIEFGNTFDSRVDASNGVPITYLVNRITDRQGNYIKFNYEKTKHGLPGTVYPYGKQFTYPKNIEYTFNDAASLQGYNKIEFEYIDRKDPQWNFLKGEYIGNGEKLMSKIKVLGINQEVRRYEFKYKNSAATGNSLLWQIQECAGTLCHEPTIFKWQDEQFIDANTQYKNHNTLNGPFPTDAYVDLNKTRLYGDWDGDGVQDMFVFDKTTGVYNFYLNRFPQSIPSGFSNQTELPNSTFVGSTIDLKTADINADGKTDILLYLKALVSPGLYNYSLKIIYCNYYSNSLHFYLESQHTTHPWSLSNMLSRGDNRIVDFNNDGIPDLVGIYPAWTNFESEIQLGGRPIVSSNSNFNKVLYDGYGVSFPSRLPSEKFEIIDFNRDGLCDVIKIDTASSKISILKGLSTKISNTSFLDSSKTSLQSPSFDYSISTSAISFNWSNGLNKFIPFDNQINFLGKRQLLFMDVNGDGLPDLGIKLGKSSYQFQINTGNFSFLERPYLLSNNLGLSEEEVYDDFIDFNNDGVVDLLSYSKTGSVRSVVRLGGTEQQGREIESPLDQSLLTDPFGNFSFGSFTKTGYNELLYSKYTVSTQTLSNKIYNNLAPRPDFINVIKEGSGQEINITYKSIKDPSVYKRSGINFKYPLYEFVSPMQVVATVSRKNGVGGFLYTDYFYEGAFVHAEGRGFRGFSKVVTKDRQRNIFDVKCYTIDPDKWWLAGQPFLTETRKDDPNTGQLLAKFQTTTESIQYKREPDDFYSFYPTRSYYTYGKNSVSEQYDLINSNLLVSTKSTVIQDKNGNTTSLVVDHGDGVKDSTVSVYTDNEANWILGRLTRSTTYRTSSKNPTEVRSVTFEYNPLTGQLTKEITDPDSSNLIKSEVIYTHDIYGNIIKTEAKGWNGQAYITRFTDFGFDTKGRFKTAITNALGHQTISTYNQNTGSLLTSTDINGLTTTYEYDAFQRITKVIAPNGVESQEKFYRPGPTWNSPAAAKFLTWKKSGNTSPIIEHYDELGRVIKTERTVSNGNAVAYTSTFNANLEKVTETGPGVNKTFYYDAMSRVVRETDFGTDNTYDYVGNNATVTDIKGRKQVVENNNQGQTLRSRFISSNGTISSNQVDYKYDGRGNVLTARGNSSGFIIKNTYNARGHKIKMEDPVMGTFLYQYNSFNELIKQTNPKGEVVTFEYDILGRIKKRTEPEGITTYTYDIGTKGLGRLSSVTNYNNITFSYTFDNLGRPASESKIINAKTYTTSYTYYTDNKPDLITYPSGLVIKHEYNALQYLTKVKRLSDGKVIWELKATNNIDAVLEEAIFAKGAGQNPAIRNFNIYEADLSHIKEYKAFLPNDNLGTPTIGHTYNYENNFRISSTSQTVYKSIGQILYSGTTNYTYDDLDRLTAVTPNISFPQTGTIDNTAVTLSYDLFGNILNKSDVGTYNYSLNESGGPKFLTSITPVNASVCIPSFSINTEYTTFNKVKRISNDTSYVEIFYGPDMQRAYQKQYIKNVLIKTKIFVHAGFEEEIKGAVTEEVSFIRGGGRVVALEIKRGTNKEINLWINDKANNLVAVLDSNGLVLQHLRYDVWGRRLNADRNGYANENANYLSDRGFTKHEHLDLFQLINMNGRMYDPVIARFLSPDPYIQDPSDLQSYNRYAYVRNNPISLIDPSGYSWDPIGDIVKGATSLVNNFAREVSNVFQNDPFIQLTYNSLRETAVALDSKYMPAFVRNNWRVVTVTVASYVVGAVVTFYTGGCVTCGGAAAGFTSGFLGTTFNGGSLNDALQAGTRGAVYGAISAFLTSGIGDLSASAGSNYGGLAETGVKVIGHAAVQGTMSAAQGGDFWQGARVGALTGATSGLVDNISEGKTDYLSQGTRVATAAIIGGTISEMSGGKFASGAATAAFVRMFNDEQHYSKSNSVTSSRSNSRGPASDNLDNTLSNYEATGNKHVESIFKDLGRGNSGFTAGYKQFVRAFKDLLNIRTIALDDISNMEQRIIDDNNSGK